MLLAPRASLPLVRTMIASIVCLAIGCAGASSKATATEFRASDAELFDDNVDWVESPLAVESARRTFERRVGRADLIAIVRVESLSSDLVRRRSAYRLATRIEDRLKGSFGGELILRVEDDEAGYHTVQSNEDRLLRDPFIAFVKWEDEAESAEPVARWHLSPASDAARQQVQLVLSGSVQRDPRKGGVVEP